MTIHKQLKLSISSNTDATQVFIKEIKPKFRLKNPRSSKPSPVFMEVIYGGERSRLSIHKCKVYPHQWSVESQRAFVSSILLEQDNHNNVVANKKIEDTLKRFHTFLRDYCVNIKDIETFHAKLKIHMGRPRKKKEETMDVFEEIRKACINAPGRTDKTINENYIGKGLKALKAFSDYKEANGDTSISDFSMLNASLFNEFYEYLESGSYKKENGENYAVKSLNSIIKYAVAAVKCLPVKFMPEEQRALIKQKSFKDLTDPNNAIALRDNEVMKLWRYKPKSQEDEEIRDMFLLLCTLGVRGSDISGVDASLQETDGIEYLNFVQYKTGGRVKATFLFELAKKLVDKYENLPLVNIKRKINNSIGRIAKEAGITGTETLIIHYVGEAKPREIKRERVDLIKTHTGRRTFVSMLSVRGWSYEAISKFSGHKDPTTVKKYDKTSDIDIQIFKRTPEEDRLKLMPEFQEEKDSTLKTLGTHSMTQGANSELGCGELKTRQLEYRAKEAAEILMEAAELLEINLVPKGRTVGLLTLSEKMAAKREEIKALKGEAEYEKIKYALQFGKSEEERELLGKYFCTILDSTSYAGWPVIVIGYEQAQKFWEKQNNIEIAEKEAERRRKLDTKN